MIKNVLKNDLVKLLPHVFSKVLTVDFVDEDFIQKVKQNKEASLTGILTHDSQAVWNECDFNSLHRITLGRERLPFDDKSFTLVIGENIFSNCLSLSETISELYRILVDDGILITAEPNIQYYHHFLKLLQGQWDETLGEGKTKLHFFTPVSLATLLNNSSFFVRVLSPLETDSVDYFPISGDGFVHVNRYHLGPLTPKEHELFLIKRFLTVVSKSNGENSV